MRIPVAPSPHFLKFFAVSMSDGIGISLISLMLQELLSPPFPLLVLTNPHIFYQGWIG
jgi:hypothetical protein